MSAVLYICEPVFNKTTLHWRTLAPTKSKRLAAVRKAKRVNRRRRRPARCRRSPRRKRSTRKGHSLRRKHRRRKFPGRQRTYKRLLPQDAAEKRQNNAAPGTHPCPSRWFYSGMFGKGHLPSRVCTVYAPGMRCGRVFRRLCRAPPRRVHFCWAVFSIRFLCPRRHLFPGWGEAAVQCHQQHRQQHQRATADGTRADAVTVDHGTGNETGQRLQQISDGGAGSTDGTDGSVEHAQGEEGADPTHRGGIAPGGRSWGHRQVPVASACTRKKRLSETVE